MAANIAAAAGLREGHPVLERSQERRRGLEFGSKEVADSRDSQTEQPLGAKPSAPEGNCSEAQHPVQGPQPTAQSKDTGNNSQSLKQPDMLPQESSSNTAGPQENQNGQGNWQSSEACPAAAAHDVQIPKEQEHNHKHVSQGNADELIE